MINKAIETIAHIQPISGKKVTLNKIHAPLCKSADVDEVSTVIFFCLIFQKMKFCSSKLKKPLLFQEGTLKLQAKKIAYFLIVSKNKFTLKVLKVLKENLSGCF